MKRLLLSAALTYLGCSGLGLIALTGPALADGPPATTPLSREELLRLLAERDAAIIALQNRMRGLEQRVGHETSAPPSAGQAGGGSDQRSAAPTAAAVPPGTATPSPPAPTPARGGASAAGGG